jgi:hypothetical protein
MGQETVIIGLHHCINIPSCQRVKWNLALGKSTMPIDPYGPRMLTESAEGVKGMYETLKHSVRSFSSLTTVP